MLKNNYFEFNSKISGNFNKFQGKLLVLNLHHHMDNFDTNFLKMQQLQPLVWFRYIDNFFIWAHGEEQLKIFLNSLNEFDPYIKFTYESNKESIAFLDIKVSLRNGKVFTISGINPTDCHQYLHYLSVHPYHTKKSVVFSQTLQISKLCSLKIIKKK